MLLPPTYAAQQEQQQQQRKIQQQKDTTAKDTFTHTHTQAARAAKPRERKQQLRQHRSVCEQRGRGGGERGEKGSDKLLRFLVTPTSACLPAQWASF